MQDERLVFTRKSSGLVKGLSAFDVFLLVISAPAGSGILYYSVSTASSYPGGNVGVSFLLGMLLIFPIIFLAAATSSMVPRSGSLYVLISRVINPAVGFLAAALFFFGYTLSIGVVAFIVVQVFGGILVNAGSAAGASALVDFGQRLQEPLVAAVGGVVLVALTWFVVARGVRVFRQTMRILFGVTVAAALATVGWFLTLASSGDAANRFDGTWGEGVYSSVMSEAAAQGWSAPGFSWESTLGLLLVVLFSYAGLELVSYASGEIAQRKGKAFRGYLAGWIVLALTYSIIAFSVTLAFGDFLGSYDYLFQNHPEALEALMPAISPSIPFYVASVVPSQWLGIALAVGLTLWLVTTMIPYFFAPSRLIFALAMDRAVPTGLAEVHPKTNVPTKASALTFAFALLGVLLNLMQVATVLGTIIFCATFVYWLYGLSAALVPFTRPDLFANCAVQTRIAGFPLVSLVGILSVGVGWFVIFIAVGQLTPDIAILLTLLMTAALCLYVWQLRRNKAQGVDVGAIYGELPPE